MSNIMCGENWEYLHTLNTNQSCDIFHEILMEILDQVSPEVTVRSSAKQIFKVLG